jgi:hypothetical protein
MSTTIIQEFRADHQRIMGALVRLRQPDLTPGDMPGARRVLGSTELLGSHFTFEELRRYLPLTGSIGEEGIRHYRAALIWAATLVKSSATKL